MSPNCAASQCLQLPPYQSQCHQTSVARISVTDCHHTRPVQPLTVFLITVTPVPTSPDQCMSTTVFFIITIPVKVSPHQCKPATVSLTVTTPVTVPQDQCTLSQQQCSCHTGPHCHQISVSQQQCSGSPLHNSLPTVTRPVQPATVSDNHRTSAMLIFCTDVYPFYILHWHLCLKFISC